MQALVTKWFKPMDPSKVGQYHDWLFEKEQADREKRIAEREARIREERERLRKIQREKEKKRKEAERVKREAEAQRRAELAKRKLEGQLIVPGVFIGGRLAAQNYDWLNEAISTHNLSSILNCTPNVRNYFDSEASTDDSAETDDMPLQELEELAQQLDQVHDEVEKEATPTSANYTPSTSQTNATASSTVLIDPPTLIPSIMDTSVVEDAPISVIEDEKPNEPEEEDFFAEIEKLDDDAKLALLESIKLPGDEENASENVNMEETEPIEAEVEDEAKKMLEKHKQRLTIKGPALKLSYQRIPIEDDGRIDVQEWFDVASSFIQQAREKGEAVLIHCREGRSRSVTMTIAYLMIGLKMTLKDAMVRVKEVILDENINFGFKTQLMALDLRVHGFNSIDYASKRRRNTTINTDYSDSLSEATGAPRRSKRTRKTKKSQAEEGDEEYDATTQELAPPVKVKATTSSISKSRPSTASSTEAQPSTSSAPIDEHRPDSTPADMMAVDEHVDIETVPDQTASNLPNKTPSTDAMDVDVEVKSEPAANEASTGQKPDSSLQASQKPKPQSSPAPKKETATAEPKKSKTATSSANTPTKGKKKAAQIPVQKNTLFNYFGKK